MGKKIKGVSVMYIPSSRVLKDDDESEKMIVIDIYSKNLQKEKIRSTTINTSRKTLDAKQIVTALRENRRMDENGDGDSRYYIKIHDCEDILSLLRKLAEFTITESIVAAFDIKKKSKSEFLHLKDNRWSMQNLISDKNYLLDAPDELKKSLSEYGVSLDLISGTAYGRYDFNNDTIRAWQLMDVILQMIDVEHIKDVILDQTFDSEEEIRKYVKDNMSKIIGNFNTIRVDSKALLKGKFDTDTFVKDFNSLRTRKSDMTEAEAMIYLKNYLSAIQVFKKFND